MWLLFKSDLRIFTTETIELIIRYRYKTTIYLNNSYDGGSLETTDKTPLLMKLYETYVYLYIVDLSMYVSCRLLCDKEEIIFLSLGKLICRVDSIYCKYKYRLTGA